MLRRWINDLIYIILDDGGTTNTQTDLLWCYLNYGLSEVELDVDRGLFNYLTN